MNDAALENLKSLLDTRAWLPGIAAGMLTMSFGASVSRISHSGEKITTGEIALHIQCPWRIIRDQVVLVGSSDYGAIEDEEEAIGYIHDRLAAVFSDEPRVEAIESREGYAFRMRLSNGALLDVLPTQSHTDDYPEFWRIFRVASDAPHFVAAPEPGS